MNYKCVKALCDNHIALLVIASLPRYFVKRFREIQIENVDSLVHCLCHLVHE
jgi:hypothetical protein